MNPHPRGKRTVVRSVATIVLMMLLGACEERSPTPPGAEHAEQHAAAEPPADDMPGMSAEEMAAMGSPAAGSTSGTLTIAPARLQAIGVRFETAALRPLERLVRTVGRVAVDERRLSRVNLKVEGWIDRLYVNATGQVVRQGQPLLTLYSPELIAAQQEYLLAMRNARALGGSEFGDVAEGAKSLLDASRRRLELWDVRPEHLREIERTGEVPRTLPIHAPQPGTVIDKMAVQGMRVDPGQDLYTIADLRHVWILADIYEYELPFITVGQRARISLSYDPGAALDADLTFIYPTLDPQSRTAQVRFELDNPEGRLKPEMYANVELRIPFGIRLAVPRDAVLQSGERQIIFIHKGGGQLEWRTVRIGVRAGNEVEIVEGLQEGEHIVTSANFLIDSESQVRAAMTAMPGMGDMKEMPVEAGATQPPAADDRKGMDGIKR
jgi:Cu(I)/Ag(I) efflux system membrane fusion protein